MKRRREKKRNETPTTTTRTQHSTYLQHPSEDIPTYVASCWSDRNEKQLFICNNDFMALSPYTAGDGVWVSEWIVKCTSIILWFWMFFFTSSSFHSLVCCIFMFIFSGVEMLKIFMLLQVGITDEFMNSKPNNMKRTHICIANFVQNNFLSFYCKVVK